MNNLTIVTYHYVRDIKESNYPKIKGLETSSFINQLDYLMSNFNIIKAEDVIECVKQGKQLPQNACLLTFDDGYKDHHTYVLPELLNRRIHGCFFPPVKSVVEREILDVNRVHFILASTNNYSKLVDEVDSLCVEYGVKSSELISYKSQYWIASRFDIPDVTYIKHILQHVLKEDIRNAIASELFKKYVNKPEIDFADDLYLSLDETKNLVNHGMYVGSHGFRHLWLEKETYESQTFEIDSSLKFLKNVGSSLSDWIMCYPYGSYNKDTLEILKDRNCAVGFTTRPGTAKISQLYELELPRYDTNNFPQ
jgi:peptidoglycan/xylan/chitin deacetylase (PgdA/CDA1 family)